MAQTFKLDDSTIRKTTETVDTDLFMIADSQDLDGDGDMKIKAIARSNININTANVAGRVFAYENFI